MSDNRVRDTHIVGFASLTMQGQWASNGVYPRLDVVVCPGEGPMNLELRLTVLFQWTRETSDVLRAWTVFLVASEANGSIS